MNIREATIEDIGRISEVERQALTENAKNHYEMDTLRRYIPDDDSQYYRLISGDSDFTILVAVNDDDTIIGFGTVQPNGCQIHGLYISPKHERQGVGSKLLSEMTERLDATDCETTYVMASLNAESFYKEHGFERVERASLGQNAPIPVIKMQRRL